MKKGQFCVICGKNLATTHDHIPPKGLFPKPRPKDLITIPACENCNHGDSKFDEIFKVYANLHVSRNEENEREFFDRRIAPTTNHNLRLKRDILKNAEDVILKTPAGIELGPYVKVHWNIEAYTAVFERITRGLHWFHTGEILGDNARVRIAFLNSLKKTAKAFEQSHLYSIANKQFLYKGIFSKDLHYKSAWVFEYRGILWAGGYVEQIIAVEGQ